MNLFPDNPGLLPRHRRRLEPFLRNAKEVRLWIEDARPSTADLKRAVMIEVERGDRMRKEVVTLLLVTLGRYEREDVWRRIKREQLRIEKRTRQ